jgi:hypothetical protein
MRFEEEVIKGGPSVLPGVHRLIDQVKCTAPVAC